MRTPQQINKTRRVPKPGNMDWGILYAVTLLVAIGAVMIFSASYVQAGLKYNDSLKFLKKDLLFAGIGFVMMYIFSKIDYRIYGKLAKLIMIVNLILLAVTLKMKPLKGSRRWLLLFGFSFQTSELTKYACIIMTAWILTKRKNRIRDIRTVMEVLCCILISVGLIMQQRDLSTSVTIIFVGLAMLFISGTRVSYVLGTAALGIGAGWSYLIKSGGYQSKRIEAFLNPFESSEPGGYQTVQSLYALASGHIKGLGLGRSKQKFFYLPEPQNDFIFAIIGEELGYIGAIALLLIFTFLVGKCLSTALKAPDNFSSMLAAGIGLQIGIQVLFNVGVATASLPNTGIALPFISYGGSSLVVLMTAMGIVLNISRYRTKAR